MDFQKMEQNLDKLDLTLLEFKNPELYDISIPKFTIQSVHNLPNTLKEIGIQSVFNSSLADFSKLTNNQGKYPSKNLILNKKIIF